MLQIWEINMDYTENWEIIKKLGEGGQGKVYLVRKKSEHASEVALRTALGRMTKGVIHDATREQEYEDFRRCILEMIRVEDPSNQGALKELHKPEDARDAGLAEERIKREIEAMSSIKHHNLVQILDVDPNSKWYVSKFYPNGTLAENNELFKGNLRRSLQAIRPLVLAVTKLHEQGYVHRDIKPHNVFLGMDNELILGDFGLIYFADSQHTRVSEIYENVGSRDWMPPWAMGLRIEEVKPTFDVFALGKLLWYMLSGKSILRLWYFDRPQFNVEELFPHSQHVKFANPLFSKCIVEEEKDCLPDAKALLDHIDTVLNIIDSNAELIANDIKRYCKVCGIGEYNIIVDGDPTASRNFGIPSAGSRRMKIFTCSHCGHVQLFSYDGKLPPAWKE